MIPRLNAALWMVLIVGSVLGLYVVKYRVQGLQAEIVEVSRQLEEEQENLHVVAAEWAYLNQPERLQRLAERYLSLEPITMRQIADIEGVPLPGRMVASADGIAPAPLHPAEGE